MLTEKATKAYRKVFILVGIRDEMTIIKAVMIFFDQSWLILKP